MEIWDAYDKDFNKVNGKTLIRGEKIPKGLFHLVCDIIVRHVDGSYLLMRRSETKKYGGMWEASAGGSALVGESPMECAMRELKEETGICCDNLIEVGKIVAQNFKTIYFEFLCLFDGDKNSIVLQEGETSAFKWVDKKYLLSMGDDELVTHRIQNFVDDLKQK